MNNETFKDSYHKLNINWYPGHMAKSKKQIIQNLKLIDVAVEILDARIPISSHNPDLDNLIKTKKRIIVLNKSDLAEEKENKKWKQYFESKQIAVILADCNKGKGVYDCINKIQELMSTKLQNDINKGKVNSKIRVLVIGIPNVGKSSFINKLTKKNSSKVGNKPGVTLQNQWFKLNNNIELLDTPGVLWPKLEPEQVALNLAFTGTIKEEILPKIELAYKLLMHLSQNYKENLINRYNINDIDDIVNLMEHIGKKRGALLSGNKIDMEKTANIILDDFKTGKLGKITLERID